MSYLWCSFRYAGSFDVQRIVGGNTRGWGVIDDNTAESFAVDKCQLLLTPLSAISDEHAVDVARICFGEHFPEKLKYEDGQFAIRYGKRIAGGLSTTMRKGLEWVHIIDYLRSKSYHVPYMGIDLFETNIALDVTKINEDGE